MPLPTVPTETVNQNAFLLWVEAGKPMGADFGAASRAALTEEMLRGGSTIDDVVARVAELHTAARTAHEAEQRAFQVNYYYYYF